MAVGGSGTAMKALAPAPGRVALGLNRDGARAPRGSKREMGRGLRPVDRLLAGYNVVLALVWLLLLPSVSYASGAFAAHMGAILLPYWLARVPKRLSRVPSTVRHLYPLLVMVAFWAELGALVPLLHRTANEGAISALEEAVFGIQVSVVWIRSMPQMWLSEIMHFSYFGYYAAVYLPPLAVAFAGRTHALRDMVFRLMVTYLACFLVYLAFPVRGPHALFPHYEGPLTDGFFYRLVDIAHAAGDSRQCAFPSSHVAGTVTMAFLGWRWFSRGVAVLLTAEAVGVLLSTVYTQSHYAVDAVSGLVFALALQVLVVPLLRRRLADRTLSPSVPTLPLVRCRWRQFRRCPPPFAVGRNR